MISLYGKRFTIYSRNSLLNILELYPQEKRVKFKSEICKKQRFSILFSSKIKRNINLNAVRVGKGGRWKIDLKYVTGVCVELYFTKMWWRYDVVYTHTFISVHSIKKSKHKWINLTYIREGPRIRYLSIVIYWEQNPKRSHTWPFC